MPHQRWDWWEKVLFFPSIFVRSKFRKNVIWKKVQSISPIFERTNLFFQINFERTTDEFRTNVIRSNNLSRPDLCWASSYTHFRCLFHQIIQLYLLLTLKSWPCQLPKLKCHCNFLPLTSSAATKYLCNKTGILDKQLEQSCLGALYNQQCDVTQTLCPMKIINTEEIIYCLNNNKQHVYTPVAQTIPTNSLAKVLKKFLQWGVSELWLDPQTLF